MNIHKESTCGVVSVTNTDLNFTMFEFMKISNPFLFLLSNK